MQLPRQSGARSLGAVRARALAVLCVCVLTGALFARSSAQAIEHTQYYPGKFVWFDLVTDDLPAVEQFYGAVFGWHFRTVGAPPASYTLIENAGDSIGGMFYHPRPAGATASARWLSLISVPDPAATARYVVAHGGSVIAPTSTIAARGIHALFRDPQGAVFGVLKAASGDRPDTPVDDGDFFWADLLARDPAKATEFYSALAGYEVSTRDVNASMKRIVLSSEGYARAGIVPLPEAVKQPGWLPYVLVDDVPATLKKVVEAGGKVIVQPRADLLGGNLAVLSDPAGGVLGIVNWPDADDDAARDVNATGTDERSPGSAK